MKENDKVHELGTFVTFWGRIRLCGFLDKISSIHIINTFKTNGKDRDIYWFFAIFVAIFNKEII